MELFSIRIQRTFQLVSTLKNDMKKTKLENQQQVWKGCKKQPVRQQAWHIPKIWSAAYRHTGRNLCNSF